MNIRITKRTVWYFVFGTMCAAVLHALQPFPNLLEPVSVWTAVVLSLAVGAGLALGDILFGDFRIWHLWKRKNKGE